MECSGSEYLIFQVSRYLSVQALGLTSHHTLEGHEKFHSFENIQSLGHLLQWGVRLGFGLLWQTKILGMVQLIEEVEMIWKH